MLIDDSQQNLHQFVGGVLADFSRASFKVHQRPCPYCGVPVRHPVIARKADIEDFEALMKCAYEVMDEFGITGNLLASIKAKCAIEIAKRAGRG